MSAREAAARGPMSSLLSGGSDVIDSLLFMSGLATDEQRSARVLRRYGAELRREARGWRGGVAALEAEAARLAAQGGAQRARLEEWGLRRLRPAFAALSGARVRRAAARAEAAALAADALDARAADAARLLADDAAAERAAALDAGFARASPAAVLGGRGDLRAVRDRVDGLGAAVEVASAAVRRLAPRIAPKGAGARRAAVLGGWSDDFFEAVEDRREREGRLLGRWAARTRDAAARGRASASPRAILGFGNFFGAQLCATFDVPNGPARVGVRAAASRAAARALGRSLLVPRARAAELAARDGAYAAFRARARAEIARDPAAAVGVDADLLDGADARYAGVRAALASLDDASAPPADLLDGAVAAVAEVAAAAGRPVGGDGLLGLVVFCLAGADGPDRPFEAVYLLRVYGLRDARLALNAEAAYVVTVLDAAARAVARLGGADDDGGEHFDDDGAAAAPPGAIVADDADDAAAFAGLAAEADARRCGDDDAAMADLGSWLGSHAALEDTVDLLRDEGWMA